MIVNGIEAVQDGRIFIELINATVLAATFAPGACAFRVGGETGAIYRHRERTLRPRIAMSAPAMPSLTKPPPSFWLGTLEELPKPATHKLNQQYRPLA